MAEFGDLEADLSAQLAARGAAATPPADAWNRFLLRLEASDDVLMPTFERENGASFGRERKAWVIAIVGIAAATVIA